MRGTENSISLATMQRGRALIQSSANLHPPHALCSAEGLLLHVLPVSEAQLVDIRGRAFSVVTQHPWNAVPRDA